MVSSLLAAPNDCTLDDLEIVFNGIQEAYTVDRSGRSDDFKETYIGGSEFGYYSCNNCGKDWSRTVLQSQEQAWGLTKEHLAEE